MKLVSSQSCSTTDPLVLTHNGTHQLTEVILGAKVEDNGSWVSSLLCYNYDLTDFSAIMGSKAYLVKVR